jgi:hypothetical protein
LKSTVILTSQIFVLLLTFPLRASPQYEIDANVAEVHFEAAASQLKTGLSSREFVAELKTRFTTQDDAKFLDDLAKTTPLIQVQSARGLNSGIEVVLAGEKKIEMKLQAGKIYLNGRQVELAPTATRFLANVESALRASRISASELLLPRAVALAPVPLLAGAAMVYAGSELYSAIYPYTLDLYLSDLTKICEREKKEKRAFETSKSGLALKLMTEKHLIDEKSLNPKLNCDQAVPKMLALSKNKGVKKGEPREACEAKRRFLTCVRSFKLEHDAEGASTGSRTRQLSR